MDNVRKLLAATPVPLAVALDPAQQRPGESSLPYLFVVFLVTWLAFFAYAFYMTRKQQALQRDLDALRKLLDDRERQGRPGDRKP
ncbi:MAG: CcmD family protein [Dehalococcoidia bacterium]|nr:CcmD family protein [Dehalococcoidia bacterium]